jgi:hypothetical protein
MGEAQGRGARPYLPIKLFATFCREFLGVVEALESWPQGQKDRCDGKRACNRTAPDLVYADNKSALAGSFLLGIERFEALLL